VINLIGGVAARDVPVVSAAGLPKAVPHAPPFLHRGKKKGTQP
jgi:hypothetical protein